MLIFYSFLAVLLGCGLLVWAADRFIVGASQLAHNLNVSPLVIGVLLVGFATSFPEMLVSAMAAIQGNPAVGIGNALGSNITNVGLALGLAALITPLQIHSNMLRREFPLLLLSIGLSFLLLFDRHLGRLDGFILFAGFVVLLLGMLLWRTRIQDKPSIAIEEAALQQHAMGTSKAVFWLILGLVLLLISSRVFVWGAVHIAHWLGISDLVIGLTIVAIGTSLPEIAATIMAAVRKQHDIAVGNVLGSNMFNLLAVMAMPGLFAPSTISKAVLIRDYPVLLGFTLLVYVIALRKKETRQINRLAGGLLVLLYSAYVIYLIAS